LLVALGLAAAFAVGLVVVGPALFGAGGDPRGGEARSIRAGDDLARFPPTSGCYLSFEEGRFELGGPSGSYLVVAGKPVALSWPANVTTRSDLLSTAIVSADGTVLARTGQRAHIGGGYGRDDTFWACGFGVATFPMF
ncbi:MAG TPA: hypothetical protein VLQ79_07045, partial [Myxococcaceae bacterium]|nr:hypothetical protein [Myxococcaceae bacterium]